MRGKIIVLVLMAMALCWGKGSGAVDGVGPIECLTKCSNKCGINRKCSEDCGMACISVAQGDDEITSCRLNCPLHQCADIVSDEDKMKCLDKCENVVCQGIGF